MKLEAKQKSMYAPMGGRGSHWKANKTLLGREDGDTQISMHSEENI